MHTKVGLQIAQCAHGVYALQTSSFVNLMIVRALDNSNYWNLTRPILYVNHMVCMNLIIMMR